MYICNQYNFKVLCYIMSDKFNKCKRCVHLKVICNLVILSAELKCITKELYCLKKKK